MITTPSTWSAWLQVGEVREDEVDAGHVGVGEHQPAVDDEDAAARLEAEAVPPDLTEPAQEDDPYRLPADPEEATAPIRRVRDRLCRREAEVEALAAA